MVGIGFRKEFAEEMLATTVLHPDFIEAAPENWIDVGGFWGRLIDEALEKYPLYLHGLSLSVGSPDKIDMKFLRKVKKFIKDNKAVLYSEHLSFSKCDNAHLYDLLPIPFTNEAVKHVSGRIREVQDFLEQKITIEIVSYYSPVAAEMSELEFINSVVTESGCNLLLDVNNIYVNGFNHNYDPYSFLDNLLLDKVSYIHMAGHKKVSDDLIIDTHGEAIINPVYQLFDHAIKKLNRTVPVLLERDFNIPELSDLAMEMSALRKILSDNAK